MLKFQELSEHNPVHVSLLQGLLEAAPGYSLTVEGRLPAPTDGIEAFRDLPAGKERKDKLIGIYLYQDTPIGCVDLVRAYPEPHIAFLGLLLFAEAHQGHGHGVEAIRHIKEMSRAWSCTAVRLAVIETNVSAFRFWKREGFSELYRKPRTQYTGAAIVMETAL
ncbi:GNAT family N-acetyltransferase [Limnohabitans sp.]|jgi:GNAT superfamily N-acetyltransferase|uniref:GNAT family N-acetyltransferase n=1 Tax=Limnohabitans sp. TaxID=1907725 RepID=UPI0037BF4DA4